MARTSYGGAENQIKEIMETVTRLRPEYEMRRFDLWTDTLDDFDLVHIFAPSNFPLESSRIAEYAREHGKKVVTTPIFHHDENFEGKRSALSLLTERTLTDLKGLFSSRFLERFNPYFLIQRTLQNSDLVLPNSMNEREELLRFFRLDPNRFRIVPHGVDPRFERGDASLFTATYGLKDFVLFVGRIQAVKNLTGLISGFLRSGIATDLVIIGSPVDKAYLEKCQSLATGRVHFMPPLPPGSGALASAYKAAKVIALPSFHETVGLVALEGGLAGANVVVTQEGGAKEYLGDDAWYVDPRSVDSIANGLVEAYRSPKNNVLSGRIKNSYSWEMAGERTTQAYDEAIKGTHR